MLERTSLLLGPWNASAADGRVRTIADAEGTRVGFVRQSTEVAPLWLRWLHPRTLEVYESPDNSLVFTLRHRWGWPGGWKLVDADERLVGILRGRAMLDGFGSFLGFVEPPDVGGRGRFLASQGRELGDYTRQPDGIRIAFSSELEGNPFARMMLLGAIIVRES